MLCQWSGLLLLILLRFPGRLHATSYKTFQSWMIMFQPGEYTKADCRRLWIYPRTGDNWWQLVTTSHDKWMKAPTLDWQIVIKQKEYPFSHLYLSYCHRASCDHLVRVLLKRRGKTYQLKATNTTVGAHTFTLLQLNVWCVQTDFY